MYFTSIEVSGCLDEATFVSLELGQNYWRRRQREGSGEEKRRSSSYIYNFLNLFFFNLQRRSNIIPPSLGGKKMMCMKFSLYIIKCYIHVRSS